LRLASYKLPVKTKIVSKAELDEAVTKKEQGGEN
jgi:ribosomal protein L16/L10AE